MKTQYLLPCLLALLLGCSGGRPPSVNTENRAELEDAGIELLSNRADLISGGNVLIAVRTPDATEPSLRLNGQSLSVDWAVTESGSHQALIEGLSIGENTLLASAGSWSAQLRVQNSPSRGPVFSGPQLQPWACLNAGAEDESCQQAPSFSYVYKSTDPTQAGMIPYDPDNPPNDVADTTTDEGMTLPFIVRVESGYILRDFYQIAVLYQPDTPWTANQPQPQFNHKLLVNHGFGCAVEYQNATELAVYVVPGTGTAIPLVGGYLPVGTPLPLLPDATETALGAGFAVMAHALNNSKHNCNLAVQAEAVMMTKEHLIEQYGPLRYSIGQGCSGGSLAVQWIANAYPGIYQGILPTCSFPDAWSTATQFMDNHLTLAYFLDPSAWGPGVVWTPSQMTDVQGHISLSNALIGDNAIFPGAVAESPCGGVDEEMIYHPQTNPDGVRCTIMDSIINLLGPRAPAVWSEAEIAVGRGFGSLPVDNAGVQYGLSALQEGRISPAQFVDLNLKIGGLDIDANPTPQRMEADPVHLRHAYRTGLINVTNNLDQTAIIDCSGPDPGAFHDAYRTFTVRERLLREHGHHDNHIVWEGPVIGKADNFCAINSFLAMDQWLAAVESDLSKQPLAQKLSANKPADLGDACFSGLGQKLSDGLCGEPIVAIYATPRMVAGDSIRTDTNKCQRKPFSRADDYGLLPFTEEQWVQLESLFEDGVCDFSLPPVGFGPTLPWLEYGPFPGDSVVYGGQPMQSTSHGAGWASPAFGL
ncbi:MAG: DUF6351 family protein [Oceanococcaceae bacterium]